MPTFKFSDTEVSFLVNALLLAAEEYDALAAQNSGQLGAQFQRQATEARALADRIDNA